MPWWNFCLKNFDHLTEDMQQRCQTTYVRPSYCLLHQRVVPTNAFLIWTTRVSKNIIIHFLLSTQCIRLYLCFSVFRNIFDLQNLFFIIWDRDLTSSSYLKKYLVVLILSTDLYIFSHGCKSFLYIWLFVINVQLATHFYILIGEYFLLSFFSFLLLLLMLFLHIPYWVFMCSLLF